jgi:hypothetical protein
MDLAALTAFLAPCLGFLLKSGAQVTERAADTLGAAVWEHAKGLWERLRPSVEAKPAADEAAHDVAADPADEGARIALARQLAKLMEADPGLAADVEQLWAQARQAGVVAAGPRSVAVGGSVSGSTIVTGDDNVIRGGP